MPKSEKYEMIRFENIKPHEIARVKNGNQPCHIAGKIEVRFGKMIRTVQTMLGFAARIDIPQRVVHTHSCPNCPPMADILDVHFKPGKDAGR